MSAKVDLYNNAYINYAAEVYREIRVETYGQDLGQTSWVTSQESAEIIRLLEIAGSSYVLEIGCGSGRYVIHVAEKTGCRVLGIELNAPGIHNANQLAAAQNLSERVRNLRRVKAVAISWLHLRQRFFKRLTVPHPRTPGFAP